MTTIILTIIGILLAAAAALMVVYYGGAAFDGGAVKADAATVASHLTQLQHAVQLYEVQEGVKVQPGSLAFLAPYYMASIPVNPAGAGWYYDARMLDSTQVRDGTPLDLIVAGLPVNAYGTALCTAIAKTHGTLAADGRPPVTSSAATVPRSGVGCFEARGWGAISGVYVTYARVR